MSFNLIQLIGLLLVSQVVDNAIDPGINLDHVTTLDQLNIQNFKCENGKLFELNQNDEFITDASKFNKLKISTSSHNNQLNCRLLFNAKNGQHVQIILNDVLFMTTHHNSSCGIFKFEELNRSVKRNFCLPLKRENIFKPDVLYQSTVNQADKIYLSNSNNLTLNIDSLINLNRLNNLPILTLNFRFINKSEIEKKSVDFREKLNYCDHLFNQCNAQCTLQSNQDTATETEFACKYLISSQQNQSANNSRIIVSQVYTNNNVQSVNKLPSLSTECSNFIKFYDGHLESDDNLIIKYCLPIFEMPLVRSESNELLVVYNFKKDNLKMNDQLKLNAHIENKKTRTIRLINERIRKSFDTTDQSCNIYYNASTTSQRSGQIVFRNQLQDQLKDTPCFMHLISSNPFDRIWFYFLNYRPASLINTNQLTTNQFSSADSCKITELRLFDSLDDSNQLINKGKLFCGTEQPKICNPNRQQCWLPSESYLSTGSKLSLMAMNKINPSLYLLPLQFTLNYEFINTQEYGEAVPNTICDRLFDSTRFKHGTVRSTRNLFLYGRGGRQNLNCNYIFKGQPGQHLRIQLYRIKVKSTDCTQQRESNTGTNKCVHVNSNSLNRPNGPSSRFSVWDVFNDVNSEQQSETNNSEQLKIPVDCFCNKTVNFLTPISFHLIGGQATLNFTIENMRSNEDFNDYAFEAFYEFLSTSTNDLTRQTFTAQGPIHQVQIKTTPPKNYSLTTYSLTVPSNFSFDYYQEFKQRKRLIGKANENILINVPNGFLFQMKNSVNLRACSQLNRLIVYWILPSNQFNLNPFDNDNNHPVATICIEPYRGDQINSLDNLEGNGKANSFNPDQIQLSFELGNKIDNQNSQNNNQINQFLNSRALRFYANNTIKQIDLVIELIATSKGQFKFDWLKSLNTQEFHSSMRTSEPKINENDKLNDNNIKLNNDNNLNTNVNNTQQCMAHCPEDGLCLKQDHLCDQISHCTISTWDENPLLCEAKEKNRLEHFLSITQSDNKIDKITLNDNLFKNNWFILLISLTTLFVIVLIVYLIIYLRKRTKHNNQSLTSNNFPTHLQIGSLHNGTLQTDGSLSSTFSTSSSCTNSMLCDKRFKKIKQKMLSKDQLKQQKQLQQPANALSLMRSNLEDNFNPLIPSYGNSTTTIHQQIHQQQINNHQLNNQPADYVSTSEFQFELNQDRLNNYDKQNDFSPLYKKIDSDEYSIKQHIYYQPSYTTLQRNTQQRFTVNRDSINLDYRLGDRNSLDKPPLPPLPTVLQNAQQQQQQQNQSLLSYHHPVNNESLNDTFNLRTQINNHLTNLNSHTIARQSLLDSTQAERLLMSTPIYEVADRQFNNSSSMHRSAILRATGRRFS